MQKMEICLWYAGKAEEAANFYVSLFENASITRVDYYGKSAAEVSGMPENSVLSVGFDINNQSYIALNGEPIFQFTPAVSIVVNCDTQEEVDKLWDAFCKEGEEVQCGWLTDKYGLSWQIVPKKLNELLADPDPKKRERVMAAMLEMKKIDTEKLLEAYNQ